MNEKLLKWHAPCGVYCKRCGFRREFHCPGCRLLHPLIKKREQLGLPKLEDSTCTTYECVKNKEFTFCNECEEYPCERIQPIVNFENPSIKGSNLPHNSKMYNLAMIKKLGIEEWDKICEEKHDLYYFGRKIDYRGGEGLKLGEKGIPNSKKKN